MAGRPKKPDGVKLLAGTLRPHRVVASLELPKGTPEPPEWLEGEALAEFMRVVHELKASGILRPVDRGLLAVYSVLWAKFTEAAQTGGEFKAAWVAELRRLGALFGLDPSSREKLPAKAASDGKENPWANFDNNPATRNGRQ